MEQDVRPTLNEIAEEINCLFLVECSGAIPLTGELLDRFKDQFQFSGEVQEIFYTKNNILFSSKSDWENFKLSEKKATLLIDLDFPVFSVSFCVADYTNVQRLCDLLNPQTGGEVPSL